MLQVFQGFEPNVLETIVVLGTKNKKKNTIPCNGFIKRKKFLARAILLKLERLYTQKLTF